MRSGVFERVVSVGIDAGNDSAETQQTAPESLSIFHHYHLVTRGGGGGGVRRRGRSQAADAMRMRENGVERIMRMMSAVRRQRRAGGRRMTVRTSAWGKLQGEEKPLV